MNDIEDILDSIVNIIEEDSERAAEIARQQVALLTQPKFFTPLNFN